VSETLYSHDRAASPYSSPEGGTGDRKWCSQGQEYREIYICHRETMNCTSFSSLWWSVLCESVEFDFLATPGWPEKGEYQPLRTNGEYRPLGSLIPSGEALYCASTPWMQHDGMNATSNHNPERPSHLAGTQTQYCFRIFAKIQNRTMKLFVKRRLCCAYLYQVAQSDLFAVVNDILS
jgi:hypothetical protein